MVADAGALELLRYGDGGALADEIERNTKRAIRENQESYQREKKGITGDKVYKVKQPNGEIIKVKGPKGSSNKTVIERAQLLVKERDSK